MFPNQLADDYARRIAAALDVPAVPGESVRGLARWVHPYSNEPHRLDGPAVRGPGVHESWYIDGALHRLDGPAVIRKDCQVWYVNGVPHRLDGPAWDDPQSPEWHVNGHLISDTAAVAELERLRAAGELDILEMVLRLWRPDGPPIAELADAVSAATS